MATTAIWDIKGWVGNVVIYLQNPEKTRNPDFFQKTDMSEHGTQEMSDVIDLAMQDEKADRLAQVIDYAANDEKTDMRHYVSGINCSPVTARDEMIAVKERFDKKDGIVAFHGYQSFAPGEVTPDLAHEIGIRLAKELWGDRFQVLVATHLDRETHIHNHFLLNSVSFVDGKRYNDCRKTYREMRMASDRLCYEYGLSVIEHPKCGKAKHYGEWRAEQEGRPTWRSLIREEVDCSIGRSFSEREFFHNLKKLGYEIKIGQDISVRPPGKERFFRLARNLGEEYMLESIRRRILGQTPRLIKYRDRQRKKVRLRGMLIKGRRLVGIRALYYHYLYRMGILPRRKEKTAPKRIPFPLREDMLKLNQTLHQMELLQVNGIATYEQLFIYIEGQKQVVGTLTEKRKHLRNEVRREPCETRKIAVKREIAGLSRQLAVMRKDVRLCEGIPVRCAEMKEKLNIVQQTERCKEGRQKQHDQFRRRR